MLAASSREAIQLQPDPLDANAPALGQTVEPLGGMEEDPAMLVQAREQVPECSTRTKTHDCWQEWERPSEKENPASLRGLSLL